MNRFRTLMAITVILALSNCGSGGESEQQKELQHTVDSLKGRNTDLLTAHDTLTRAHEELEQQLNKVDSLDTILLKRMEQHEVTLKRHLTAFKEHESFLSEEKQLESAEEQNTAESRAQKQTLQKKYRSIEQELNEIENEQQSIGEEHRKIKEVLENKQDLKKQESKDS